MYASSHIVRFALSAICVVTLATACGPLELSIGDREDTAEPGATSPAAKGPRASGCSYVKTCLKTDLGCVHNTCGACGKGAYTSLPACYPQTSIFSRFASIWCCPAGSNPTSVETVAEPPTPPASDGDWEVAGWERLVVTDLPSQQRISRPTLVYLPRGQYQIGIEVGYRLAIGLELYGGIAETLEFVGTSGEGYWRVHAGSAPLDPAVSVVAIRPITEAVSATFVGEGVVGDAAY